MATDDWFGIVTMRIQRPSRRSVFTALNDWDPPDTCMTASVRPWVGRTLPMLSGRWSICAFISPVICPCRSGLHQTCPSDQSESSRSSWTAGWSSPFTWSGKGRSEGSKMRGSAPKKRNRRAASSTERRE